MAARVQESRHYTVTMVISSKGQASAYFFQYDVKCASSGHAALRVRRRKDARQ